MKTGELSMAISQAQCNNSECPEKERDYWCNNNQSAQTRKLPTVDYRNLLRAMKKNPKFNSQAHHQLPSHTGVKISQ